MRGKCRKCNVTIRIHKSVSHFPAICSKCFRMQQKFAAQQTLKTTWIGWDRSLQDLDDLLEKADADELDSSIDAS